MLVEAVQLTNRLQQLTRIRVWQKRHFYQYLQHLIDKIPQFLSHFPELEQQVNSAVYR